MVKFTYISIFFIVFLFDALAFAGPIETAVFDKIQISYDSSLYSESEIVSMIARLNDLPSRILNRVNGSRDALLALLGNKGPIFPEQIEVFFKNYAAPTLFSNKVNAALRGDTDESLKDISFEGATDDGNIVKSNMQDVINFFDNYIPDGQFDTSPLYRGIRQDPTESGFDTLRVDDRIGDLGFSSTSKNLDRVKFMTLKQVSTPVDEINPGITIQINRQRSGIDISSRSAVPSEGEILFPPKKTFKINATAMDFDAKRGFLIIEEDPLWRGDVKSMLTGEKVYEQIPQLTSPCR